MKSTAPHRCGWATTEALAKYHDEEWGVPCHDDRRLFEMLILEGAQAGLSWSTILNKRAGYRKLFRNFNIDRVAALVEDLDADAGGAALLRHHHAIVGEDAARRLDELFAWAADNGFGKPAGPDAPKPCTRSTVGPCPPDQ